MAEEVGDNASVAGATKNTLPIRTRQPRQQLTKGMEHMRSYVAIQEPGPTTPKLPQSPEQQSAYGVPASIEPRRKPRSKPQENNPHQRGDPFQFGTRYLEDGDDIFSHNAWDHVQADPQYDDFIAQQTRFQRENQVSDFDKHRFNSQPEKWWDRFYSNNAANFFKDRKWLVQEFPVLGEVTKEDYGPVTVLEVGAGAGNTAFPLLALNRNPALKLHACDYSAKAIDIIRVQDAYTAQGPPQVLRADVWDVASESLPPGLDAGSVDIVLMIFILSALSPNQWRRALSNIFTLLKPGGEVLFRDYGRGDLAQVRFKKDRYLDENFYVRGDGTRVYFFAESELRDIWSGNPLIFDRDSSVTSGNEPDDIGDRSGDTADTASDPAAQPTERSFSFQIINLATDRRMLVNRQRKIKMYRCWMQGRFRKKR